MSGFILIGGHTMATRFDDWEGDFLAHHGIRGQKWGQRRWQNEDGTLTSAGRAHYGVGDGGKKTARQFNRQMKKLNRLADKADVQKQAALSEKYRKRAIAGAKVTAGLAAGTAGSYLADLGVNKRRMADFKNEYNLRNKNWSEALADIQKYQRQPGGVDGATYGHLRNIMDRENGRSKAAFDSYVDNKNRSKFGAAGSSSLHTKIMAGATAAAGGYTAYAAIRSKVAKARTTDKGHQKAVAKGQAQIQKMFEQFKGTPYQKLLNEQLKKQKQLKLS